MQSSPFFTIDAYPDSQSLTATLSGLWEVKTVIDYGDALRRAAEAIAAGANKPRWLIDLGALAVQPQDVAACMSEILAGLTGRFTPIIAVVTPYALVGLQSRRVAQGAAHRTFPTTLEARAWLHAQGRGVPSAAA